MILRNRITQSRGVAPLLAIGVWLLVCQCCSKPAAPQSPADFPKAGPSQISSSADVVKLSSANISFSPGGTAETTAILSITPGYHVNANPATYPYLIATELNAGKVEGFTAGKPVYPASNKRKFQFADDPLAVYEGTVQIKLPLRAEANVTTGSHSLPLSLRVQACDEEKCFPPDTLQTTITVTVK